MILSPPLRTLLYAKALLVLSIFIHSTYKTPLEVQSLLNLDKSSLSIYIYIISVFDIFLPFGSITIL